MRPFHRSLWVASAIAFSRTKRTDAYFGHSPLQRLPDAAFATITQRSQSQRSSRSPMHRKRQPTRSSTQFNSGRETPSDFTIDNDNDEEELSASPAFGQKRAPPPRPSHPRRPPIRAVISAGEASWMDRNAQFRGDTPLTQPKQKRASTESSFQPSRGGSNSNRRRDDDSNRQFTTRDRTTTTNNYSRTAPAPSKTAPLANGSGPPKSFRQDFRGTRVFVSGLPADCSWQTLKDHFRVAGEVVFASVSLDRTTGRSKGHGIVQFETTDQATNAITIMRNHPLQEHKLFVRPDVQEDTITDSSGTGDDRLYQLTEDRKKGPTPPSKWKCANSQDDANALFANGERHRAILQTLKARDQARIRRNYAAADTMRDELKREHGVHIDDRHHLWWTSAEHQVPEAIRDLNGEGRWGAAPAWRWIPSTPESDACVDPDLVEGLLKQRDVARREKDFATADRLLEQARTAPDNDLTLRIHDESRTWRIWTSEPPPAAMMTNNRNNDRMTNYNKMTINERMTNYRSDDDAEEEEDRRGSKQQSPVEQCLEIVEEHEPEKLDELRTLLAKFPGREYNILKKIKQRYYYAED